MKRIYFITTKHLEDALWFREEDDFRVAMNYVAIEVARRPEVVVLAFILMSNHVHLVLKGREEDVTAFIYSFKQRYSIYYRHKYGVNELLRRNDIQFEPIFYADEAVERVIAYTLMNPVAANICAFCNQYSWGTGNLYFNSTKPSGKLVAGLSARECERLFHTSFADVPKGWLIGPEGYILPCNYVDVEAVEKIFRTPKRFGYFLRSSSKAQKRLEADENLPAFRDQTILAALPDLCRSLFQKDSFGELSAKDKVEFARQIKFRFSADAHQIARVCGLSYAAAAELLNSV